MPSRQSGPVRQTAVGRTRPSQTSGRLVHHTKPVRTAAYAATVHVPDILHGCLKTRAPYYRTTAWNHHLEHGQRAAS